MPHAHAIRPVVHPVLLRAVVGALCASLLFVVAAAFVPGETLAANLTRAATCSTNLRVSASTVSKSRTTISAGTRVTVVTPVTANTYRATCAGKSVSGNVWYRISAINGKSVKSLYGVSYLYGARSLFNAISVYAACNAYLRTSASTSARSKALVQLNTRV